MISGVGLAIANTIGFTAIFFKSSAVRIPGAESPKKTSAPLITSCIVPCSWWGLVWVAYQLLADVSEDRHGDPTASTFWGAMKIIIVADAFVGMDNVLGVVGAAHGALELVIIGLLISVLIVVFGSALVLKLVERFPLIVQLGGAVLALTAAKMIVSEPFLKGVFGAFHGDVAAEPLQTTARWVVYVLVVVGVLVAGWWKKRGAQVSQQLGG